MRISKKWGFVHKRRHGGSGIVGFCMANGAEWEKNVHMYVYIYKRGEVYSSEMGIFHDVLEQQ